MGGRKVAARVLAMYWYLIPGCDCALGEGSGAPARAQAWPKLGAQKIKRIKSLKIKICYAQNVGKVWISRKKSSWAHLGPSGPILGVGRNNRKK